MTCSSTTRIATSILRTAKTKSHNFTSASLQEIIKRGDAPLQPLLHSNNTCIRTTTTTSTYAHMQICAQRFASSSSSKAPRGKRGSKKQRLKLKSNLPPSSSSPISQAQQQAANIKINPQRNAKYASTLDATSDDDAIGNGAMAFLFLGVFPLMAFGGTVYVRDDLRQQFKDTFGI